MDIHIKKNAFGILLKYLRKQRKVSQIALGISVGLDNSIISRIENGEFIPSITVVESIVRALHLSKSDEEEIKSAFMQGILSREGVDSNQIFISKDEAIYLAEEFIRSTKSLRTQGLPKLAVAEAEYRVNMLHLIGNRTNQKATRHQINILLGRLLMEVSKSYMDFLPKDMVWLYMNPLLNYQRKAAEETKDITSNMMIKMSEESALYVTKDFHRAHEIGKELHRNLGLIDKNWHSEIIRASTINAGYLQNVDEVKNMEKEVEFFLLKEDHKDLANASFVLEGLARAQSSVGSHKTMNTITKAWGYLAEAKKAGQSTPLRTVQLIRTQLKYMIESGDNTYNNFEKIGTKGLILSEELGYTRYENEIRALMDSYLNGASGFIVL